MSKERLSKLQKNILVALEQSLEWMGNQTKESNVAAPTSVYYEFLIEYAYAAHKGTKKPSTFLGHKTTHFIKFQASFSRSLQNLREKGLLKLYHRPVLVEEEFSVHPDKWKNRIDRRGAVGHIEFTDKGKEALNAIKFLNNKTSKEV